jgi:predicted ATPase
MITSWTVEHFKSAYDKTTLEFAPLTIFAGANSSGKSTMIQSLLLTAQTLQSSVFGRPIVLNGHIARLGTFDDIVSNGHEQDLVRFGFELKPSITQDTQIGALSRHGMLHTRYYRGGEGITSVECNFAFSSRGEEREILQLQPRLEGCEIRANRVYEKKLLTEEISIKRSDRSIEARLAQLNLVDKSLNDTDQLALEYEAVHAPARSVRRFVDADAKVVGVSLVHFLPARLAVVYDEIEQQCRLLTRMLTTFDEYRYYRWDLEETEVQAGFTAKFRNTLVSILSTIATEAEGSKRVDSRLKELIKILDSKQTVKTFSQYLESLQVLSPTARRQLAQRVAEKEEELEKAARDGRPAEYAMTYVPLTETADFSIQYIQRFFSERVSYLGPLRDEPKPVYPLAGAVDPKDVGFRGEHTAAVLDVHRNTKVDFIASQHFKTNAATAKKGSISLLAAVLDWLNYLGVVEDVKTVDKGKLGHELKVMTPETESLHDLTHVGVGVSQVLPILVLSLLSEAGSTLIFEQPELHLHPRVQTRLADFFVSLNMLGKQCIVETHSEYIINRLRYRAVASDGQEVSDSVIIYFVEKQSGHSRYRPIKISKYGVIDRWPRGFFDEGEETAAAILKAALEKRQRDNKGKDA